MKQKSNNVHLEGIVLSSNIIEGKEAVLADILLLSARKTQKNGETVYADKMIHKVRVSSRTDEPLTTQLRTLSKGQAVSFNGEVAMNANKEQFIHADKESFSFPEKINSRNNKANLIGTVLETASNNSYATAVILLESDLGKTVMPVIIHNKDNDAGWSIINEGKIRKGDIISVSGPLLSQTFTDGEKSVYRISVKGSKFERIKKAEKKTVQVSL